MSLSLYQASIPVLLRQLGQLSLLLDKGAAHAALKGLDPAIFVKARLTPDMFPLSRQVQIAADTAKGCAARLAGRPVPSFPDTESSFPELQARIAKTAAFLGEIVPTEIDGGEERVVVLKVGGQEIRFTGQSYLLHFVLPNFFFHVTTVYALLRRDGVELGKADFLGSL